MNERIIAFIQSKGLTVAEFEKLCNLSNGAVSKMGDNTRLSTIDRISTVYPELNTVWLRTGEGEMLKSSVSQNANGNNVTQVAGNGNRVNSACSLDKALDEIAEQRKLVAKSQEQITKSQEQISKSQEQIDRLLNIIEQMTRQSS